MARNRLVQVLIAVAVAIVAATSSTGGASAAPPPTPPRLQHLEPGGDVRLELDLPVNVVFVGLDEGRAPTKINVRRFLQNQPRTVEPQQLDAYLAGEDAGVGIVYRPVLTPVFADLAFEDAFFGFLASSGYGGYAPTSVQQYYSDLPGAAEQIESNLILDATVVESWLIEHAPTMLDVDTTRPTVFYISWHGREDFQFHTYAPFTYQPEIDDFAPEWTVNHTIAWGGGVPDVPQIPTSSLGRVWFLDVSAGPDLWSWNFLLDVADIDGDGYRDRRLPPVWEYGTDHWFMPFPDLTSDLGMVNRYVAINLLFAPGPLYDTARGSLVLDEELELDVNIFEEQPSEGAAETLVIDEVLRAFRALDPSRGWSSDVEVNDLDAELDHAFECSSPSSVVVDCNGDRNSYDADVVLQDLNEVLESREPTLLDGQHGEIPLALLDIDTDRAAPYQGAATTSWAYVFDMKLWEQYPISATHLTTHEVGHEIGLRHPHDGIDPERDQAYRVGADFWFARLGDESNTLMSYIDSQVDFSQFDRDNLDRWMTAERLQAANDILDAVYDAPDAASVGDDLRLADALAGDAIDLLGSWDLRGASSMSFEAYRAVVAAATRLGIDVTTIVGDDHPGRGHGQGDKPQRDGEDLDHGLVSGELLDARVEGVDRSSMRR